MPTDPSTAEPQKTRRRWFQFQLRTMLIAVAVYCAAAATFRAYYPSRYDGWGAPLFFLACGLLGAATGTFVGQPFFGAVVGLIAGAVAFWFFPELLWNPRGWL